MIFVTLSLQVAMAKSTRTEISQGHRHREHEYENEHSTGAEDTTALPPSLAPSVIEIEEAAVGVGVMEEAERRSRRAGAGDASFVTNPDGTRTYNKASHELRMYCNTAIIFWKLLWCRRLSGWF